MRAHVLLLATAMLAGCAGGPAAADAAPARVPPQTPPLAPEIEAYRPVAESLVREALVGNGAFELLTSLCTTAPHRLSGSPGAAAAVEWGRRTMLEAGLENVRLQPCLVPTWVRGEVERLTVLSPPELAGQELPILALGGSIGTPEAGLEAELLEITSWEQLDALGPDGLAGRIAFFNRPMDPALLRPGAAYGGAVDQRGRGAIESARHGGVAALVRSMTTRLDDFPHTGAMRYAEGVPPVPAAAVSTLGAERLAAALREGQRVRVRLELACHSLPDSPSANVIGEIVGRERPEEVVLVGGHLDCWDVGQGASDDGGGCCQAIEALRLMKTLGLRPRRTVRAVLFMNEENGGRGAQAYREGEREAGALAGHVLAIESDSGPFTPRAFTTDANDEALAVLRQICALLEETGLQAVRPGGGGADIDGLKADGVIVMGYAPDGQRYFDLHHSARDTLDQVSPREIALGAACMAAMAYVVADLEERLPRNVPPAPEDPEVTGSVPQAGTKSQR
ncbi:MAG TPA: M20/M25/M40 family metallo-hydrolase [Planctomycetota bacterium]|nr:M20/M25/M40 family metallo-hydrolase [Planctomycetota bacterium]